MEICMEEILAFLNANWSIWPLVSISNPANESFHPSMREIALA